MIHKPVLLEEVVKWLNPQKGEAYLDGTAGYGGHAAPIMERLGPSGRVVLVDRDRLAIKALGERFDNTAEIIHSTYSEAAESLLESGDLFDLILLDLGVSSPQFDMPERGFSFSKAAQLDMRMDQSQHLSAAEVVNNYSVGKLGNLLRDLGQEPRWRQVAQAIVEHRPFSTTTELAKIVGQVAARSQTDPSTKTFQAIRMEVNDELAEITKALPILIQLLTPGGRMAVISFHSLEDRIVKQFIDTESRDCICPPKQPVCTCNHQASVAKLTAKAVDGAKYDSSNPRARSAKLRAVVKINKKTKGGER
jgi:16S rRNA (cytosine1402-N4)-methyltransferase